MNHPNFCKIRVELRAVNNPNKAIFKSSTAFSEDIEINGFEVVQEPESIPGDDDEDDAADELLLSRVMAASKNSSEVRN